MHPSISIIVPVYNVSQYLEQCLDSLINQTKTDIEIICINDGSTDDSLNILTRYAVGDNRIIIIDKKNGGLGAAYNEGIDRATGTYLGFVESDDYVDVTMFEKLFEKIKKDDTDIVRCGFYKFTTEGGAGKIFLPPYAQGGKYYPLDIPEVFLGHPSIWTCLYRRETLEKNLIRFMETPGASFQDAPFWFDVLSQIENISFLPESLYGYRVHPLQSASGAGKPHFTRDIFGHIDFTISTLGKQDADTIHALKTIRLRRSLGDYMWPIGHFDWDNTQKLNVFIQQDYGDGKHDSLIGHISWPEKIKYLLLRKNLLFLLYLSRKIRIFVDAGIEKIRL